MQVECKKCCEFASYPSISPPSTLPQALFVWNLGVETEVVKISETVVISWLLCVFGLLVSWWQCKTVRIKVRITGRTGSMNSMISTFREAASSDHGPHIININNRNMNGNFRPPKLKGFPLINVKCTWIPYFVKLEICPKHKTSRESSLTFKHKNIERPFWSCALFLYRFRFPIPFKIIRKFWCLLNQPFLLTHGTASCQQWR